MLTDQEVQQAVFFMFKNFDQNQVTKKKKAAANNKPYHRTGNRLGKISGFTLQVM